MANQESNAQQLGDPLLQVSFSSPEQKKDKEFGRKLLSDIYKQQNNTGYTYYFGGRTARFQENIKWAMGRQTMQEFMDLMKVDGNNAYTGIDPTPNRTGPQFVETLVNSMSQNEEYPSVTAIDEGSLNEKEQRKFDALFRMMAQHEIGAMQQNAGPDLQLEPQNAYIPEDELSAEVYFKLEDRLPKEIEFEQKIEKVMNDNQYPSLKRRLYRDGVVVNVMCTKIDKLEHGFIAIRKPTPANLIYNFFMSDSGKMELSYIGEVYSLKVRDLRKRYGKSQQNPKGMDEKELFELCKNANQVNVANRFYYNWTDDYLYNSNRPYDDFSIQVFDCEIKVFDTDYYVSKKDSYGRENIQEKKGVPQPTSEKAEVLTTNKFTVYRGIWAIGQDKMIYWGLPDVVIKPYMDISESLFSYTINIPNNDGDYVPSLFERALEPLRQYALCKFRLKQLIASMAPAGITIDTESIRDIEFNGKILPWEEILKIRNQTGVVLWSSRSVNPNESNSRPPIEGIANAESVTQMNELAAIMDRSMQEIRSVLGVPLYRDGSDLPPRMGAAVVENQTTNSNNVTDFIVHGFHQCIQETFHKVCILKWDDVVLKDGNDQLMGTEFQVAVEMRATQYENQLIESQIATWSKTIDGNGNPLLSPKDVFKIRQIKNFKLQDLYLSNIVEQNRRRAMEQSAALQTQNAQIQSQVAQQAAQQAAQLEQQKADIDIQVKQVESKAKKENTLLDGVLQLMKAGVIIPPQMQPLVDAVMMNVALPIAVENQEMQQQIREKMIAEQQAAQQQAAAQQQIQEAAAERGVAPEQIMQEMQAQQQQPQMN